jgi:hypothetical protein
MFYRNVDSFELRQIYGTHYFLFLAKFYAKMFYDHVGCNFFLNLNCRLHKNDEWRSRKDLFDDKFETRSQTTYKDQTQIF